MAQQRFINIDGLRAIAALSVFAEHMFGDLLRQTPPGAGPMNAVSDTLIEYMSLGRFGVTLFFLISGFVVPFSIGGERPLFQFAVSRAFRLYPALWLALAVLATILSFAGEPPKAVTVLANMTMAPAVFGQPWLSQIYWTLFVELVFYVLAALLFSIGKLRDVGVLAFFSLALVAITAVPAQLRIYGIANLPVEYLSLHLSSLFLGLLLRLWLVERAAGARLAALALIAAQVATVLSVAKFSLARGDNFVMGGLTPIFSSYVLAYVVFLAAVRFGRPHSILLSRIGLISYSIYLFHWSVNAVIYPFLPFTGGIGDVITMLICTAITLLASWLVYRLVERPMIMFGRVVVLRYGIAGRP